MRAAPGPAIPAARPIAHSWRRVDMAQLPSSSGAPRIAATSELSGAKRCFYRNDGFQGKWLAQYRDEEASVNK